MPIDRGASNQARERNIKAEIAAGKPPRQAVAIGYSEQRAAKKKQGKTKRRDPKAGSHDE